MKRKQLRSGYTTGACAAASAKAATVLLLKNLHFNPNNSKQQNTSHIDKIDISLPDGERATFKIQTSRVTENGDAIISTASTIKFAGDDPDVTNGAEIIASLKTNKQDLIKRVRTCLDPNTDIENLPLHAKQRELVFFNEIAPNPSSSGNDSNGQTFDNLNWYLGLDSNDLFNIEFIIKGGQGVGIVTKPGLPVPVGSPAINPVPQRMIKEAVLDALKETGNYQKLRRLEVTISIPNGEKLTLKTLNPRLGIIGGISILGTTGIVKPLSTEAWTATISTSMDVAMATGCKEIVISSGRTSEKAHIRKYQLPEESYVMMGDYLEFSLLEARKRQFKRVHLCAQWAKMLKIAMSTPQTHVKYGAIDMEKTKTFLYQQGILLPDDMEFNTAREIFEIITSTFDNPTEIFGNVCLSAKMYCETITGGVPVICHLASYDNDIILVV